MGSLIHWWTCIQFAMSREATVGMHSTQTGFVQNARVPMYFIGAPPYLPPHVEWNDSHNSTMQTLYACDYAFKYYKYIDIILIISHHLTVHTYTINTSFHGPSSTGQTLPERRKRMAESCRQLHLKTSNLAISSYELANSLNIEAPPVHPPSSSPM